MTHPAAPDLVARAERRTVAATLTVAALAWVTIALITRSPAGGELHHHRPSASAGASAQLVFTAAWLAMVAAMMLPASTKFVRTLRRLLVNREHGAALVALGIWSFALVWLLVGQLFQLGDIVVHTITDHWPWLNAHQQLIAASALALAGGYQLAPVKMRCLRGCRNPAGFAARLWHGVSPRWEVFQVGVTYGWSCVGCCWALMLVMFAAGVVGLWLMAALAAVMVAERYVRRVHGAVVISGVGLFVVAALVAVRAIPSFAVT